MKTEKESLKPQTVVEKQSLRPFLVEVFRNVFLGVLAILTALAAYFSLTGSFPDYFEPVDFSSCPSGPLVDTPMIMHYGFNSDSLASTIRDVSSNGGKSLELRINNGHWSWAGVTFGMEETIPSGASFDVRWRGGQENYRVLVDLTIGGGIDDSLNSAGTNYYVYLDAPHKDWTTVKVPLSKFQLNPVQRPGASFNEKFNSARIREVSLTFFPGTKSTLQIESVRFVWGSTKWSSLILIAMLLIFGFVLWWRTTVSNIFPEGKMDLRSSTVFARLAYTLFAFSIIAKIVSSESSFFSTGSLVVYGLFFLCIVIDEFFRDVISDKPILMLRYGLILAVGWYLNFTLDPVQLILLLAIAFMPMILNKSSFILVGLPAFAFLVLFTHPVLGMSETVLPGSIIIGSLALVAVFIRENLRYGDALREAAYASSLYADVLESTSDAVFVIDTGGTIERVNGEFELLTGYEAKAVVGRNIADFVYPDDIHMLLANKAVDQGSRSRTYDLRLIIKNGQSRSVLVREVSLYRDGQCVGHQAVATDISERKRAEEILRESEERFHSLFDNATIGIYRTTPDGRILMVNPAVVRMLGYDSFEELSKRNLETTGFEPDYPRREFRERLERDGVISGLESAWTRKDGSTVFVRESAKAIRDGNGKVLYYDGTFEDITEQKKAEEALRLTRFTVERVSDSVYWMDKNGQFIDVNEAACETLGYTRDELLNLTVLDIDAELSKDNWHENWQLLRDVGSRTHEVMHRAKDGKLFPVEVTSNYIKFGDRELVCAFGRDITERKRAEEASAHLAAIVESSSDAIIGKDLDGIITSWNTGAQRTYGYTPAEAIGHSISMLAPSDRKDEIPELINTIKRGEEISHYDTVRVRRDGTRIDASLTLSPVKNNQGEIVGVSTVARDITENKRIERALRESEEQNRAIINAVPDMLFRVSEEGVLLDFRAPDESVLFLQPEAFLGKNIKEVLPPQVWEPAMKAIGKVIESNGIETFEYELQMHGKGVHYYEDRVVKLSDHEALSVIRDITERKHAERALAESEDKYRTLFTSSPETIFIIGLDGTVLDCNPAAEKISGRKKEEIIGTSFRGSNFSFLGRSAGLVEEAFRDILINGNVAPFEIEVKRDDDAVFWFSISASLLKKSNAVYAVQAIVSDITKRKQAEESLRQLNAFNEMLIETLPFGISIVDEQGRILFMSEKLKESLGSDMVGKECWIAYKDDSKQCGGCPLRDGIEIGQSKVLESSGVLGGRTFQISHTGLIYNGKKGMLEIFQDVTENKKLQSQFVQAQKMESLGTLASGIAHDFNNILGIILGHSSLIEQKIGESSDLSKNFNAITKAADRGAALVRQMLTFARKADASFTSLSVNDSVKEIQKLFHETFPKTMILSCELSDNLPSINADATQIHQVLLNLCVNARDAMSGNGMLMISTRLVSGESIRPRFLKAVFPQYVLLEVSDTGVGIDEETRQHIFEPFFTTKELGKGTGLGLAVVFGIMEDHEGFVDVHSEVGRGTTFYLYFPAKSSQAETSGGSISKDESSGGKETILVVEDEEMLRELASAILSSKGYSVLTAIDGEEGVEVFRLHQDEITLVLSDLGLPKLTGKDVLKKVKEINPSVKFILATGFIDPDEKSEIFRNGASDIIQKPYSSSGLAKIVREVLDT